MADRSGRASSDPFYRVPADWTDLVVEVYKRDVDRTLLRENLKLTAQERSEKFERAMRLVFQLRRAAIARRTKDTGRDTGTDG